MLLRCDRGSKVTSANLDRSIRNRCTYVPTVHRTSATQAGAYLELMWRRNTGRISRRPDYDHESLLCQPADRRSRVEPQPRAAGRLRGSCNLRPRRPAKAGSLCRTSHPSALLRPSAEAIAPWHSPRGADLTPRRRWYRRGAWDRPGEAAGRNQWIRVSPLRRSSSLSVRRDVESLTRRAPCPRHELD